MRWSRPLEWTPGPTAVPVSPTHSTHTESLPRSCLWSRTSCASREATTAFGPRCGSWLPRLRVLVPGLHPFTDVGFEGLDAAVVTATQQVVCEVGEPTFDLVQPGRVGRGVVHVEPRVPGQPFLDRRGLVCAVVVADEVHVNVGGYLCVDLGQELLELDRAVSPV